MKYVLPFYLVAMLQVAVYAQADPDIDEAIYRLDSAAQRGERYERLSEDQSEIEVEMRGDTAAIGTGVRKVGDFVRPQANLENAGSNLLGWLLGSAGTLGAAGVAGKVLYNVAQNRQAKLIANGKMALPGVTVNVDAAADAGGPTASGRFQTPRG